MAEGDAWMIGFVSNVGTLRCSNGIACGRVPQSLDQFRRITGGPSRGRFGIRRECRHCENIERREREKRKREARDRARDRKLATKIRQSSVTEFVKLLTEGGLLCRVVLDKDVSAERLLRSISYRIILARLLALVSLPPAFAFVLQIEARHRARTADVEQLRQLVATLAAKIRAPDGQASAVRWLKSRLPRVDDVDRDKRPGRRPSGTAAHIERPTDRRWTVEDERRDKAELERQARFEEPCDEAPDTQGSGRTMEELYIERLMAVPSPTPLPREPEPQPKRPPPSEGAVGNNPFPPWLPKS
jgi:hypothetical protein